MNEILSFKFQVPHATHTETVEGIMCKNKTEVKTKKSSKDEVFYLRDYLGRSLSNCDRIEVDEHVNNQTNLKKYNF